MSAHAAEGEARAEHAGSKALRSTALRGLRRLIAAVGDGDALAFVLPGVASGLLRALLLAGALPHSSQKTEAAVRKKTLQGLRLPQHCASPPSAACHRRS